MIVYLKTIVRWDGEKYAPVFSMWYEYDGPWALCCGASDEQKDIQKQQTDFFKQVKEQTSLIFGNASSVFNDMMNTFVPTVAAGPNQEGFSAAEKSNLQSQAITGVGNAYKNAGQAVKEASAAVGGGNMALPGGAEIGRNLSVANAAAAQTSGELSQINQEDYEVGRENYQNATRGLAGSTQVFNPATSSAEATTGAGSAAANTANQIAQENNSWVGAVTGALGGLAGTAMTGGMSNLGKGVGFFGQNAPAPGSAT